MTNLFWVGKHATRHCEWDVGRLHLNQWDVLEARGYSRTNMVKYPKEDIMVVNVYGRRFYFDKKLFREWLEHKQPQLNTKPEVKPEEDHIEEAVEKVEEPIGKPKDALEFIKQHKAEQWLSAEEFLSSLNNEPAKPYTLVDTKRKMWVDKVYEITFKDTWKSIYWIFAKKYGQDVFIKIAVDDEWMMYREWYVDTYGEKIE